MKLKLYFSLVIFLFIVSDAIAQSVVRGPYLQLGTPNSMIIRWRTNTSTNSKVWYGPNPGALISSVSNSANTTEHEINITGLTPNTIYYYAVGSTSGQLAGADSEHYFKTSPATGSPETTSIWVLGDAGKQGADQVAVRDGFYAFNGSRHTDLILALGDNAYDSGTDEEYQYSWFEGMYETSLINSVLWSTAGNHDVIEANSAAESGPYYDIFNFPRNGEAGGVASGTEAWYSFDYGNIHFVCLNSEDVDRHQGDPIMVWLEEDLASTNQPWIIVYFHRSPYYTSRVKFLPILEAGGVDLVLYGHEHSYQRSYLMKEHYGSEGSFDPATMAVDDGDGRIDGDGPYMKSGERAPYDGTIYMLTGSAGTVSNVAPAFPFQPWRHAILGSTRLTISGTQLDAEFVGTDGNVLDYFTISKGPATQPSVSISSPTNGTSYPSPQTIAITANATDPDGQISRVEFFANGASVGTDFSAPYSLNWTIPGDGSYSIQAVATDNDGNTAQSPMVDIQVGIISTCIGVSLSSDDSEQAVSSGGSSLSSSDLELGSDAQPQWVGLRFLDLNIPENVQITSAELQFTVDENTNINPCTLNIYGEKSTNPATFSTAAFNISNRNRTQTSISWSPPDWTQVGQAGAGQRVDVSAIVQEIVNQNGHTADNPIAILIEGVGKRVAQSYDKDPTKAPQLCIVYTFAEPACEGIGDNDNDGVCNNEDICPGGDDTLDADSDGVPDFCDACPNSATGDSDNDGVCDNEDICPGGNDMLDTDSDGVPDFCDACPNSATGDSDNDDVCDNEDICPAGDDAIDSDSDGLPDACDPCPNSSDNSDADNDGVCDTADVCPGGDDTLDADGDGTPDFCDACPNSATGDSDNDGVCDDVDRCPGENDALDMDSDGVPDACDDCDNNLTGTACDDGDPNTLNDVIDAYCNCAGTPNEPTVIDVQIVSSSDDVEERESDGRVDFTSSDLELINDGGDIQTVGLRFNNVSIPPGSAVEKAYVQFTADETFGEFVNLFIEGEASGNAPPFSAVNYNVSTRPRTSASVGWNPSAWNVVGERGLNQRTTDISSVIQEIVSRPDWVDGSSIVIIITGSNKRTAEAYDGVPTEAASLHIEYYEINCDLAGQSCDDGDPCTTGDVYDALCNCSGVFQDADDDGVCDMDDSCPNGDDNLDSDSDGLADACDSCPNSATGDSDNDGVCDDVDACPGEDDLADADSDGVPDACDVCPNSATDDSDNDGICDDLDQCIGGDDRADADSDGIPDACDSCPNSAANTDEDNDGVCDDVDVCPNGDDTLDADSDGVPDACDSCPNSATGDSDNDGVCDDVDACPGGNDTHDSDSDGLPDACDPCDNALIGTSCDDGDPNTINDVIGSDCSCAGSPNMPTIIDVQITDGNDDVEERESDGRVYINSSDLELVNDRSRGNQTVGLRFNNILLPPGASIEKAYVQFTADETLNTSTLLLIEGEASGNATSFSNTNYSVSTRPRTSASVPWNPPAWNAVGERGLNQRTTDISSVIQEIVSRPDWVDGNSIAIIITGSNKRTAEAYEGAPAEAASLHIEYYEVSCDLSGQACDDGDPCTAGDAYNASCNCVGVLDDSDGDGVCNNEDICPDGDDNIDSDNDGVPDACDPCPQSSSDDSDNDGVCDDVDACPNGDDTVDSDNDGMPDACDDCPNSSPNDIDNDGVCDDVDICLQGDNNIDSDSDGVPDACDPCPNSPANADADNDGVCDDVDVCPNGDDTVDSDNDGVPDACDDCPNSVMNDSDSDGVCDDVDVCPGGDDTIDSDSDGVPDACDTCDNTTIGDPCDDGNPNTNNDVVGPDCVCAGQSDMPTIIDVQVTDSDDDAEERETDGRMYLSSTDLELVNDGKKGNQTVGIRFKNILVPPGASIQNAYIQFTADETFSGETILLIEGQASINAPAFSTASHNISSRARTNASVSWTPPDWLVKNERGFNQQTADISSIIEEIVGLPGWNVGNSAVIILTGTGKRVAESFDGVPDQAASLHIEYVPTNLSAQLREEPSNQLPSTPIEFDQKTTPNSGFDLARALEVEVRPNPFRDEFFLIIQDNGTEIRTQTVDIHILDITGRPVYQRKGLPFQEKYTIAPQQNWPRGIYFVRLQAGEYVKTIKLLKQ